MRRFMRWILWAGGLGAVAWSALWFLGRGEVDAWFDREIAAFAARGVEIDYAAREISGFPFAYHARFRDVTLRDAASGAVMLLPEVAGEADVSAPGRITTALPPIFTVSLPVAAAHRAAEPRLPEMFELEIQSDTLAVTTEIAPGGAPRLGVTAEQVMVIHGAADAWLSFAVEAKGLDATLTQPAAGAPGDVVATAKAAALEAVMTTIETGGPRMVAELVGREMAFTGRADPAAASALAEVVEGLAPGQLSMTLTGAPVEARVALDQGAGADGGTTAAGTQPTGGGAGGASGALDLAGRGMSTAFQVDSGMLALRTGLDGARIGFEPATGSGAVAGAVSASIVEAEYRAPVGPSDEMKPLGAALSIVGLRPDDRLWSLIDADGKLDRGPGDLGLEIDGTARFTQAVSASPGGGPLPIEFGTLEIARAELSGLGAKAEAEGRVKFIQPAGMPHGRIELTFEGALGLLKALREAGSISQDELQQAALFLTAYTRAGEGEDLLHTDVTMDMDGLRVNGERVD